MSLKDQLLKAGLSNAKQARRAEHEKRQQAKDPDAVSSAELARQQRAAQALRDRELNQAQEAERQHKAVAAQIRQLIERHRLSRQGGELAYQFSDGKKIKKLYVQDAQQEQLVKGQIGIARLGDGYELLPAVVLEKIRERDAAAVVVLNSRTTASATDADDPYAAYVIPDDLMW